MPEVEVVLSTPLAQFADGESKFRVPAGTFQEIIDQVYERHPTLRVRMEDKSGALLPFVSVYIGEDNIRDLGSLDVAVAPNSTVMIMSAVAGG
ncbi:MoaD/ThiS family protein [Streptomyces sp. NPDC086796]|uniref:MoaD/ThiS family protein n=1 Tax=unclassified Streptomyces TaxID=2593676 RepID=UPI0038184EBD